jgi:hypothetical protein
MDNQNTSKVTIGQIAKAPVTYMLMVALSLMWFFVYRFGASSDQVNENCEAEKTELRKELREVRADNAALVTSLLVKNGIILQQAQEKKEVDSTLRKKVGTKAKEILREN